ncbi:MAG: YihY/virulence factor BrkB family protein [Woeseiaceae bacterium]|nr:YihY/virulence factor BrkB family protein [Woeseiaceae bacterium]
MYRGSLVIGHISDKIEQVIWGNELRSSGRAGRLLNGFLRYLYGLLRDIVYGQLTLRAMSLVYTTLLSIVPLIAFSFSVLKGFGVHQQLEPLLLDFLEPLGEQGREIGRQVMTLVDNVKGGLLGGISLAFFIYTAISMVQKVEESFNYVWYVTTPRSFARRFTDYAIVLLIGPVAMVIAIGTIASIQSSRARARADAG